MPRVPRETERGKKPIHDFRGLFMTDWMTATRQTTGEKKGSASELQCPPPAEATACELHLQRLPRVFVSDARGAEPIETNDGIEHFGDCGA